MNFFKAKVPAWLAGLVGAFVLGTLAVAAPSILNGSLVVPVGGGIQDNNATINTCVATNGAKSFVYGAGCVDTANQQSVAGVKLFNAAAVPNPSPTGPWGPAVVAQATASPTVQSGNVSINGGLSFASASQTGTGLWQFVGNDASNTGQFVFNANNALFTGDIADFDIQGAPVASVKNSGAIASAGLTASGSTASLGAGAALRLTDTGTNGADVSLQAGNSAFGPHAAYLYDNSSGGNVMAAFYDHSASPAYVSQFSGPLQAAQSNTTTKGYVGPCYTTSGASCGSTFHTVLGSTTNTFNGNCAAYTSCSLTGATLITFSGAGSFSGTSTYGCKASASSSSNPVQVVMENIDGNDVGYNVLALGAISASGASITIGFVCQGT